VATSGDYQSLTGLPTLGTLSPQDADNVTISGGTISGAHVYQRRCHYQRRHHLVALLIWPLTMVALARLTASWLLARILGLAIGI
jgi:hypothetical protein